MSWISTKDRLPTEEGGYIVVRLFEGTLDKGFFKGTPAYKKIQYIQWITRIKLESQTEDKAIYVKYKCFEDIREYSLDEIIYWYELDPIPD